LPWPMLLMLPVGLLISCSLNQVCVFVCVCVSARVCVRGVGCVCKHVHAHAAARSAHRACCVYIRSVCVCVGECGRMQVGGCATS